MSWHARAWRGLAGPDGVRPGLPIAELLAPGPLAAIAVLAVNDWWWKPSGLGPAWLTGKVSDVAGMIALPLVLTAALALILRGLARAGVAVDWTLRTWKLGLAVAVTAGLFTAAKLSASVAAQVAGVLGDRAHIVADPTDLIALPALALAWWHGRRTIARVPYGRLAWLAERRRDPTTALADVTRAGADPAATRTLIAASAAWLDGGPVAPVEAALSALRGLAAPLRRTDDRRPVA